MKSIPKSKNGRNLSSRRAMLFTALPKQTFLKVLSHEETFALEVQWGPFAATADEEGFA